MGKSIIFGEKKEKIEYINRIGVYGIAFNNDGKIALIKTSGGYFLPGGGIENSESHRMCLHREFMEETGYEISIGKYIGKASLYHITKTYQYMNGTGCFYIVKLKEKVSDNIEKDHELLWKEPKECVENLFLKHQAWAISKACKNV